MTKSDKLFPPGNMVQKTLRKYYIVVPLSNNLTTRLDVTIYRTYKGNAKMV